MNKLFINGLIKVREEREDLFLCDSDQVWELYNIGRSLRRGTKTRTREEGIPTPVVDLINRWKKGESHGGSKPGDAMRDHYTEIRLIQIIEYSLAL